jgi:hypothetical protein
MKGGARPMVIALFQIESYRTAKGGAVDFDSRSAPVHR